MGTRLDNATGIYMTGIRDGKPREAMATFTGARYTQHSTGVPDGKDGFVAFFDEFLTRNPVRDIRIVRGFEDGNHVFVQAFQSLNDGEFEYVTMDFFDSDDDGKIIEHWDVIEEYAGPDAAGRTPMDGATAVTDLDRTDDNKALVRTMISECLMPGGRRERLVEFVAPDFAPPDSWERTVQEVALCTGSGNFVATLCRTTHDGAEYAQVDLVRVEGGLIADHWGCVEPVPEDTGNSGKF